MSSDIRDECDFVVPGIEVSSETVRHDEVRRPRLGALSIESTTNKIATVEECLELRQRLNRQECVNKQTERGMACGPWPPERRWWAPWMSNSSDTARRVTITQFATKISYSDSNSINETRQRTNSFGPASGALMSRISMLTTCAVVLRTRYSWAYSRLVCSLTVRMYSEVVMADAEERYSPISVCASASLAITASYVTITVMK